jgi:hypothetical protein
MKLTDNITWTKLLPSGEVRARGAAEKLLIAIIDRQPKKRLPPLAVLADILSRGLVGGGQGGGLRWQPFDIEAADYEMLKQGIAPSQRLGDCEATRVEEWRAWCGEIDFGIPYDQHLRVLDGLRAAEVERDLGNDPEGTRYSCAIGEYFTFMSGAGAFGSR